MKILTCKGHTSTTVFRVCMCDKALSGGGGAVALVALYHLTTQVCYCLNSSLVSFLPSPCWVDYKNTHTHLFELCVCVCMTEMKPNTPLI